MLVQKKRTYLPPRLGVRGLIRYIRFFIVEGPSDENALAPALEQMILLHNVKFKVMHTDITSDFASTADNIEKRIKTQAVKKFLSENPQFKSNDICGIVHIVDLDGAFVPDDVIKETGVEKALYYDSRIECKDRELFLKSKNNKANNLMHLSSIDEIAIPNGIVVPYSIFYMSCNLDHVLYEKMNLTDEEKRDNSIEFADEYDEPVKFKEFFNKDDIKINGTYSDTWNYAQEKLNSLKKGSNFWILINKYI